MMPQHVERDPPKQKHPPLIVVLAFDRDEEGETLIGQASSVARHPMGWSHSSFHQLQDGQRGVFAVERWRRC